MGKRYRYTVKILWGLAKSKELRLTDEELHLLVSRETGKDSIRELNGSELALVCRLLQKQKDDIKRQNGTLPDLRGNPQTTRQRRKISELEEKLGWEARNTRALSHRMYKVDAVEWLTYYQCQGLIEAMKAMLERQGGKEPVANER
ncbi:regulatory protein GemA [Enterocloster lavalensis]|uniref:regulatory protein GemA n=1 Tax=Enterocloster lavalensis TaxID=460384 RepID=UPI001D076648|nr:regulatory protein GemA [Enterocloster lavalensis]MCB6345394.1 regulatory protein GemA [Enterocloster lavalensis]